jgi:ABC-type uncharacterized transport system auxiliary subunit
MKKARDPLLSNLMLARSMETRAINAREKAIVRADARVAEARERRIAAEKAFEAGAKKREALAAKRRKTP